MNQIIFKNTKESFDFLKNTIKLAQSMNIKLGYYSKIFTAVSALNQVNSNNTFLK